MSGAARVLAVAARWGGAIVSPRASARALAPGEGEGDLRWIVGLYLLGNEFSRLIEALAALVATRNFGGVLALVSALAWALIPVLLLSFVVDAVLGRDRGGHRGMVMVPLLLLTVLARVLEFAGLVVPGADELPLWVGAAWSVSLALVVRRAVPGMPARDEGERASPASPGDDLRRQVAVPRLLFARGIAGGLVAATLVAFLADVRQGVREWGHLGPLGANERSPTFEQPLVEGGVLRSDELEGRVTLLAFWATWCGVCRSEMPMIDSLARAHAGDDLRVFGVNIDEGPDRRPRVDEYLRSRSLNFSHALDAGPMRRDFRVSMIPHVVLIGRDGTLRHVHQGRVRRSVLDREIATLLAESGAPLHE